MWRQNIKQEAGATKGKVCASAVGDMAQFYEWVNHGKLLVRSQQLGFPWPIVRMALAAYRMLRIVTTGKVAIQAGFASRSVTAGCSLATSLIKVYYLQA